MPVDKDNSTTFIGKCNFRGGDRVFGVKVKDRRQHTYVIGQTGTGKTTLLKNLVLQDIRAGKGVAVIDPHGQFAEEVLDEIPEERMKDVVYFNPVDVDFPIGFNVIEVPNAKYKHLIVSDLLGIFTKIWANVWSARMEYILQNCILALIDTPGTTLLGISRILVDKDYREKIVANVKDPVVKSFWLHEYEQWRDQFRSEAIVPIQNKVGQFLNTSFIRNIVGQETSTLRIADIMNEEKILLVNVSKGEIGEDNSGLLGAMIITKIQLAAMERVRILEEERKDFYLYVDEFQNFATDSFANILSEARKYRLDLVLAHQYIGQLVTSTSTKVRDAIFGNVGTFISFRVGAPDAEFLETQFAPEFTQADLIAQPNHHIYLRLMVDGVTSRPFSAATLPPLKFETNPGIKEQIMQSSRELYARPRAQVERNIARWSGIVDDAGGGGMPQAASGKMFDATCWNCGKETQVPFQPDGKRPAYCLSCFKQIEEGKLIPLPERMPQARQAQFASSLGDIGIEFVQVNAPQARPRKNNGAPQRSAFPSRVRADMPPRKDFPPRPVQPSGQNRPMNRPLSKAGRPVGQSSILSGGPVLRTPPGAKPISLSTLQPREQQKKDAGIESQKEKPPAIPPSGNPRPSVDVSALKKALAEALQERDSASKQERPIISQKKKTEMSVDVPAQKKEQIIKPGEAVKF
ncbi:MAG: type IV secretion system DNA-binding domain-containing protein [Candidatus Sungbacteria bacterium]|nr:type IV secretion system DNA-binding domain-containing protein [Candidatus Sungbacteria bacterium]